MGILFIIKRTKLSKITKIISRSCNHLPPHKGDRGGLGTIWNHLERALALLERRIAVIRVRVCDGNAMLRKKYNCPNIQLRTTIASQEFLLG